MISKIFSKSSGSTRNRIRYIYGSTKHDHEIDGIVTVAMNCLSTDPLNTSGQSTENSINEMVMEFDMITGLRRMSIDSDRKIKPVFHAMLSLRPGESLTVTQWEHAVHKYMADLGFTPDNKYIAVMHQDKQHQHVHIVANRIRLIHGFPIVSDKNERYKSMESAGNLEDFFSLSKAPQPTDTWNRTYNHGEVIAADRDGSIPFRAKMIAKIAGAIEKTVSEQGDMFTLVRYLRQQHVYIHLSIGSDGQPSGIAYELDGVIVSGRRLKRSRLTFQRLISQEGIFYDPTTILALEIEASKRNKDHQLQSGPRYLYIQFTSKHRNFDIKFQPQTRSEQEIAAMIEAILMFLSMLFGFPFESKIEKKRREALYIEYVPTEGLNADMFNGANTGGAIPVTATMTGPAPA
ncbi:relaxase/mobilization nuclease domain-containing protein [Pseudomonas silvicola]|nr:relaxase/mobilization nuclease domain-containing protein [Pseudomonas silvicola]